MTFISFAQNYEDVILWRALRGIQQGFYIDIGAWSPDEDSVTRAFSDRGWRGINAEPNPVFFTLLEGRRPLDTNLRVAVGDQVGQVRMSFVKDSGLSTADPGIAQAHEARGWEIQAEEVPMTTLAAIWVEQVPPGQAVHFLKVDVEGFERQVLAGNDWTRNRPWIVVVEATLPLTQVESHAGWEPLLLKAGYSHCYSDGLNRFYLAQEHLDLLEAFKYPPNVFDDFVTARMSTLMAARAREDELEQTLASMKSEAGAHQVLTTQLQRQLVQTRQQLVAAESACVDAGQAIAYSKENAERVVSRVRQELATVELMRAEAEAALTHSKQAAGRAILDLRQELQHQQGLAEAATRQAADWENAYAAVIQSVAWRASAPLRRVGSLMPMSVRRTARRALRVLWWTVTPWRYSERVAYLRKVRAQRANLGGALVHTPAPAETLRLSALGQYADWIRTVECWSGPVPLPECEAPFLSVLVCGSAEPDGIVRTLTSLRAQRHASWELLIGCCGGRVLEPSNRLQSLAQMDARVSIIEGFAGRAQALQACLLQARGMFVAVLDAGDLIVPQALDEIAAALQRTPHAEVLYSDEDQYTTGLHREVPYFKPSWSPELLYAFNYFGRLTLLKATLLRDIGGFNVAAGAAVEWEANLRLSDQAATIERIAKVLVHRPVGSQMDRPTPDLEASADYRVTIEEYWARHGFAARATTQSDGTCRVFFETEQPPLVSIIVPTKNKLNLIRMCIDGLLNGTDYERKEIVIVDTGSDEEEVLAYYESLRDCSELRIVRFDKKFNYSAACNYGASCASGDLFLFLNNDIEVVSRDWLREMVGFALRPGVGVVGTKLIYPSLELQHGGVALGIHLAALMFRSAGPEWGLFGSADCPRNWMAIMGACQMVPRRAFEQIGGFDEAYQVAMSDVALCMQLWHIGYRTAYVPGSCLVHHEGATRGHANPVADIRRLADDIWRLGIEEDPYLHPELDGTLAIPALRRAGGMSVSDSLSHNLVSHGTCRNASASLILSSDGECAAAVELPRRSILWAPQPVHLVNDKWSMARWCIDLLRSDARLRGRFPTALSDGVAGPFSEWLIRVGRERFGLGEEVKRWVIEMFEADISARARQSFLFRDDLQRLMPHGLTPAGNRQLFVWFFQKGRQELSLRPEEIWWLFLVAAEQPALELVRAYNFSSIWQALYPDGLTVFGRRAFSLWFRAQYRIEDEWAYPDAWPVDFSADHHIRISYLARSDWQSRFPLALEQPAEARALVKWLKMCGGGGDRDVRDWCAKLNEDEVAQSLMVSGVNVFGHFCYPSGLRVSVEALVQGLHCAGVHTSLRDVKTDVKDDPRHVQFDGFEEFDITIIHTQPEPFFDEAHARCGLARRSLRPYRIAYWYWEFDSIPEDWVAKATQVDEVWTATEFIAKGLRERLSIPVRTLFPGAQLGNYQCRDRSYFGIPREEFTFLFTFHMMSIMERKNPLGLIRAFNLAFSGADAARLVLKTSFGDRHPAQLEELKAAAEGSRITVIDEVYSQDEVLSLMDVCDAYVSLHRSEGLGLTIAEAMLMGKPVVATGYSGNVDFANEGNSLPVSYELVKVGRPIPPYDADAIWAEPSIEDAARQMRRLYEDREFAHNLGERARQDASVNLSVVAAGQRMAKRLTEIRERRRRAAG